MEHYLTERYSKECYVMEHFAIGYYVDNKTLDQMDWNTLNIL